MLRQLLLVAKTQQPVLIFSLLLYLPAVLLLIYIGLQPFVPISDLTRDTLAIVDGRFYYGLLSNIGLLFWCATASVCLFSAYMLRQMNAKRSSAFLVSFGAFTSFLLLDDMFLLHEQVFPEYLHVKEKIVEAIYPLVMVYLLITFRYTIFKTSFMLLVSALGFLAISLAIDVIFKEMSGLELILEDGFKFLGIVGWGIYFMHSSTKLIAQASEQEQPLMVLQSSVA